MHCTHSPDELSIAHDSKKTSRLISFFYQIFFYRICRWDSQFKSNQNLFLDRKTTIRQLFKFIRRRFLVCTFRLLEWIWSAAVRTLNRNCEQKRWRKTSKRTVEQKNWMKNEFTPLSNELNYLSQETFPNEFARFPNLERARMPLIRNWFKIKNQKKSGSWTIFRFLECVCLRRALKRFFRRESERESERFSWNFLQIKTWKCFDSEFQYANEFVSLNTSGDSDFQVYARLYLRFGLRRCFESPFDSLHQNIFRRYWRPFWLANRWNRVAL